ncbi:alpha-amylase [Elysia marginata]|uniref:Alpha-amylase n=1 Tax=Elysia marginata TaxID=1093978 RepID=A0AAV4H8L9_9GAST|nr:alpha-amylase [Elysia marginata]
METFLRFFFLLALNFSIGGAKWIFHDEVLGPQAAHNGQSTENGYYDGDISGDIEVIGTLADKGSGSAEDLTATDEGSGSAEDLTAAADEGNGSAENLTAAADEGSGIAEDLTAAADEGRRSAGDLTAAADEGSGSAEDLTAADEGSGNTEYQTVLDGGSAAFLINGEGSPFMPSVQNSIEIGNSLLSHTNFKEIEIGNSLLSHTSFKETIVFLKKSPNTDSLLYIRGGNPTANGCTVGAEPKNDPCAIPINNMHLGLNTYSYQRDNEARGDHYLSWAARENGQPEKAKGTPAMLTTNATSKYNYSPLNTFGKDYWMARFEMDCAKTSNGYFEVKGFYEGQIEAEFAPSACTGNAAEHSSTQPSRGGHLARCGYTNVFSWGASDCQIMKIVF